MDFVLESSITVAVIYNNALKYLNPFRCDALPGVQKPKEVSEGKNTKLNHHPRFNKENQPNLTTIEKNLMISPKKKVNLTKIKGGFLSAKFEKPIPKDDSGQAIDFESSSRGDKRMLSKTLKTNVDITLEDDEGERPLPSNMMQVEVRPLIVRRNSRRANTKSFVKCERKREQEYEEESDFEPVNSVKRGEQSEKSLVSEEESADGGDHEEEEEEFR